MPVRRVVTEPVGGGFGEHDAARAIAKIESLVLGWVRQLAQGKLPSFHVPRIARRNENLVNPDDSDEPVIAEGATSAVKFVPVLDGTAMTAARAQRIVTANRRYAGIVMVLRSAAALLRGAKTATQRELYYMDTNLFAGGQAQCNAAILTVSALLREPRHCLGVVASSRGFYTGRLRTRHAAGGGGGGGGDWHDPRTAGGTGASVNSDWISHALEVESDAQFLLVVEKDGAFARLSEDRFYDCLPCIIVTGQGFPPVAVRAMVRALQSALNLPAYGLVDCGPFGLSLLLTYVHGGARMGEQAARYTADVKWLGLRPSQLDALDLPAQAYAPQSDNDQRRARTLAESAHVMARPELEAEVDYWSRGGYKVELEGLHALGLNFLSGVYLERAILRHDYI